MSTTNLFVELVVIGVFAIAWIALLLIAFFGIPAWPWADLLNVFTAAPVLALVYVLGIVTDRLADWVFEKLFSSIYDTTKKQHGDRLQVLRGPEKIAELGEYARSRARICRGVVFNSVLILVAFHVWVAGSTVPISSNGKVVVSIAVGLLAVAAWVAWWRITKAGQDSIGAHARMPHQKST